MNPGTVNMMAVPNQAGAPMPVAVAGGSYHLQKTSLKRHARIQDFFQGGGGGVGPGPTARKQSGQRFFFLVLNLFYSLQRGFNGFITEKTILFQGSRGDPTFSRGGGGSIC